MTVPISYTLADSTFLIINQLLMIQPVTLTVGRKVVGQLSLNDKSTDFSICTIYPQGLLCAQWRPYLVHADRNAYKTSEGRKEKRRANVSVNFTLIIVTNPFFRKKTILIALKIYFNNVGTDKDNLAR